MAWTTGKVALPELAEAPSELDDKARQLATLIRQSKHFIVFTGAGISTSAGIPDFRGPEGAWTLQAQGRQRTTAATSSLQAIPTATHMALVGLQDGGLLKYVVSQNCDGLHRRSGILPDKISELHGNNNREICKDCGKEYLRDFRAVADDTSSILDHRTGRRCARSNCGGPLHDTIINFTESLPERDLSLARHHADRADLCLVLGSSLTVTPANEIPEAVGRRAGRVNRSRGKGVRKGGKVEVEGGSGGTTGVTLAICNLQVTPLDEMAGLSVHAKTDDLMVRVMRELEMEIPEFILRRRLAVLVEATAGPGRGRGRKLVVAGVDVDGTPVSFLRTVKLVGSRRVLKVEPFAFDLRGDAAEGALEVQLELEFMGHYGEPNLEINHVVEDGNVAVEAVYVLEYNPRNGEWNYSRLP
ncbi:DHS-like NAD/FAD-binding domain-containing protein [Chaetomium sp. MPI-SDFR-AT-0129]|nr:DHS-like NAD/FAD-binding domain-containing protein [Chaetomium sp. MPI-SDFR-AT-0129]